jgi:glycosyltransferase involved in cell wall biosynthesis
VPIAIVITSFSPGGSERQMIEVIRRLDPRRWTVHVACFHRTGAWLDRVEGHAASITEFPLRSFRDPRCMVAMRSFADWCRRNHIAVVHTSELYSNIFALPAAALARVPVRIGSRRELTADKTAGQIALQRAAYAFAHMVVANAEAAAQLLRRELVPARSVVVVPNGLDLGRFTTVPAKARAQRIVMVANLRPGKGHGTLIEAAPAVLARVPTAHFDIVGDGTERERLIREVQQRELSHAFTFHGHCEDIPARLAEAAVFVLPSHSEAFPNAVLEAMAAGRPVVASSVGGILEVVRHERTGLLVQPGDSRQLADALCRVLDNEMLGARLGAAGRKLVEETYSFDRMLASLDDLYSSQLERRRVTAGVPSPLEGN